MTENKNDPLISIITVCYNSNETIEETIKSVINQTYNNIEYIIIDGDSLDNTLEIVGKYSSYINLLSEPDKGIYDAMNKSLQIAKGDWLYFLGADDKLFNNEIIEEMVSQFCDKKTIYYGNALFKISKLNYVIKPNKWSLCYRNISHQTLFYPREVYQKFEYKLDYPIFADHIYNIKLFKQGYKFVHIEKTVVLYNDAGKSSFVYDQQYYDDLPKIVLKDFGIEYGLYVFARITIFRFKIWIKKKCYAN